MRTNHTSLVYDNKMWVLGGYTNSRENDVWYSTDGIDWEQATDDAAWSDRYAHTSLVYDNKMWVLGGYTDSRENDVWYSTDGINWEQATDDAAWSGRNYYTSLVYDNKMWVLGGYDDINYRNDVWYSTDGINWEQATASADWSIRRRHTSLVYGNKMWVLGGEGRRYNNDVWYSTDGINWEQATDDAAWSMRTNHTSLVYDNKMWVLGGADGSSKRNDVWYSTDGINWEQTTGGVGWSARNNHTSYTYDNKMWVLGGSLDYLNQYNDVWSSFISNDSTRGGIELALGEKVSSYLVANEKEYYSLQLSAGNYKITTEGSTNTLCSLYNVSNELLVSNDNGGVGENCSFIFSTSVTENVSLRVQGGNIGITGGYSLIVVPIVPDVNIRYLDTVILYEGVDSQITTEIQNIGISTADNTIIKYYFTPNNQISSTDTPNSTSTITNLGIDATTNISSNIRANSTGVYYYGVCLETVNELNLANNCLFKTVNVHPKADITVNFSAPSIVYLDNMINRFKSQATLINQGGISEPILFNYYKSPTTITIPDSNNLVNESDIRSEANQFLKNSAIFYRVRGIENDSSVDISTDITVHSEGVFYYGICVENVRSDDNIADNCTSQKVIVAGRVNLAITNFQTNKTISIGGNEAKLTARLQNNSSFISYNNVIRYFRSTDNIITAEDVEIGVSMLDNLAANTAQDTSLDFILGTGSYYYGVCVDSINNTFGNQCSNAIFIGERGSVWEQAIANTRWSERYSYTSLVYNNKMWVLGGTDGSSRYNDVWYSTDGINWVQATGTSAWSVRSGHTSLIYNNKMWVLGGTDGSNRYNDAWYSTDGINWVQATGSTGWSARSSHTSLVYSNKMWVLGGTDGSSYNDVWYSTDGINWSQATDDADWSGRYFYTSLVYDNKMWVLGGVSGSNRNDVWYSTNGINWLQATGAAGWSERYGHNSYIYDNKMWVIGGYTNKFSNDVWYSTDGINWLQATGAASWSGRYFSSSHIYDNKIWVLGGSNYANSFNDIWYSTASNDNIDRSLAISLTSSGNDYSSDAVVVNLQAGAESYYKFQLTTGNYIIETSSDIGTSCSLYNNQRIALTTNNNSGTNECRITHTVTTTTDLYLQVKGNTASTTGFYQLLIRKNTTSTARTSIRVAANTILRGTQKTALISSIQPQIQGRLEVQDPITKEYGTVCSDSFGQQDVIVACRELGFSNGYVIPTAQIEQGTGAILLDDLHCTGIEKNLLDCQHNGIGVHNCTHSEDIGIACY